MGKKRNSRRASNSKPISREFRLKSQRRLIMISLLFGMMGLAVVAKLFYLQVVSHSDLSERARAQYKKSVYLTPNRGTILDRRDRQLACNVEAFSVYADLSSVAAPRQAARELSSMLDVPFRRLAEIMDRKKGFVWLKRQVSPKEAKAIRRLDLEGVDLITESRRYYPHKDLASQIIGFAGVDSQGLGGVEYSYDRYLKGNAGWLVVNHDAKNRALYVEGYQNDPENRGYDIRLTIDQNIQYFAQEEIRKAISSSKAKNGLIMVMDPTDGEILAMSVGTYFNPNDRGSFKPARYRNICLADVYEPGSTIKPLIMAGALEDGIVSMNKRIYCGEGSITIYDRTIKDIHPHADLSVSEIIIKSSNVGAIKIGQLLEQERFSWWLRRFGFGDKTGIDLPGEGRGLLRPTSKWSGISQASMSIGQEIGVTPLQMLCAYGTIANDGLLCRPRVVKSILRDGRPIKVFPEEVIRRVISPGTADTMKELLKAVVAEGTGKAAAVPGYSVAGKTGTAQKFDPATGSYSTEKYLSSFVGFLPVNKPAVVVLVMLDEPVGLYYGGSVAAPVFAVVGRRIMDYLAVPQDERGADHLLAEWPEEEKNAG